MPPYRSRSTDLAIHPSGWFYLQPFGVEITCLPVADTGGRGPLFARGSEVGRAWARDNNIGELPMVEHYRAFHRIVGGPGPGVHVAPYPLPDAELRAQGYRPGDPAMSSVEWCTRHDLEFMRRLAAANWNGHEPADNGGKHIARNGMIIGGEIRDGDPESKWIQKPSSAHAGYEQLDYMTLFHLVREASPSTIQQWADRVGAVSERLAEALGSAPSPTTMGERGPRVFAWQTFLLDFFAARGVEALPRYGADGNKPNGGHGPETEEWTLRWRGILSPASPATSVADAAPSCLGPLLDLGAIPFRQAAKFRRGRTESILGPIVHVSQNTEHRTGAEQLQHTAAITERDVSWHYSVDCDSITQSVRVSDQAWAAGPANARRIHIELYGQSEQTPEEWNDDYSRAQLELLAQLLAALSVQEGFPLRRLTPQELLDDAPGVGGHNDVSKACTLAKAQNIRRLPWWDGGRVSRGKSSNWITTNHYDPGPYFPWESVIARANAWRSGAAT